MSYYDVMPRDYGPAPSGERRPRRRKRRGGLAVAVAFVVILALFGGLVYGGMKVLGGVFGTAADYKGGGTGSVEVQILSGQTVRSIGKTLHKAGVVASVDAFVDAAKDNSRAESVQPGYYRLKEKMQASLALEALLNPESRISSRLTVKEGLRLSAVLKAISEGTDFELAEVEVAAKEVDALGLPDYAKGRPEGFLFPATYDIEPDTTPESLLADMVTKFGQVAAKVDLGGRAAAVGMTPYEIVVIASIIQAEAGRAEDFPKVARVIYNRLDRNMALKMDSTIHYLTGKSGVVTTTSADRKKKSPYNTYLNVGLPPGPINSPGELAIEAALAPAEGNWLFFVTVNPDTGETKFAATDAEHARNVEEFRAWCRSRPDAC